jgi:hypothetical protein
MNLDQATGATLTNGATPTTALVTDPPTAHQRQIEKVYRDLVAAEAGAVVRERLLASNLRNGEPSIAVVALRKSREKTIVVIGSTTSVRVNNLRESEARDAMLRDSARRCVRYEIGHSIGLALRPAQHLLVHLGPQLYVYIDEDLHPIPESLYAHHRLAQCTP